MADNNSDQEKTEQPSAKRLLDAKKKGQVPRSRELNVSIATLGGGVLFLVSLQEINEAITTEKLKIIQAENIKLYEEQKDAQLEINNIKQSRHSMRNKLKINQDDIVLIYSGKLSYRKGVDLILKAT